MIHPSHRYEMDSPQYCDRCRSTTERTHFQPYNVMPWAKPHDDPDIYSTLVSRNAAVLQSELVSIMLASIVFLRYAFPSRLRAVTDASKARYAPFRSFRLSFPLPVEGSLQPPALFGT